jgi:hypothetical protein
MSNLSDMLALLAKQRPIFHSEADFQHALAWQIHQRAPDANIRLEYRLFGLEPLYLDLWVQDGERALAVELKYPTRRIEVEHAGEQFLLMNHSARDIRCYDFIKDICRLERCTLAMPGATGYAVLLTNDGGYWTPPAHSDTADAAFRLHEGARLSGTLTWAPHTGAGTMKERESALALRSSYEMSWHDYSTVGANPNGGRFRYLLVRVDPELR